jgi:DNA-binding NtrC family response regulator
MTTAANVLPFPIAAEGPVRLGAPPAALRLIREGEAPVVVPLKRDHTYRMGRSRANDLHFDDDRVSRHHGLLYVSEETCGWMYRDLGSSNGSEVALRGSAEALAIVRPSQPMRVHAGEVLRLGTARCSVELLDAAEADAALGSTAHGPVSRAALELDASIAVASRHTLPLVLVGPSGAGKTFAAHEVHRRSARKGPFVSVNCGRLPSGASELASELLGHVSGAFTDAKAAREGRLFYADGGTLFLDEVDSLSPEAQRFLLDVLEQSGDFAQLGAAPGAGRARPDFRLISASKRALQHTGLRFDLCQRLTEGDVIVVPGLEARREDIPTLVRGFLAELSARVEVELKADALEALVQAPWPGQVRELRATVRTVVERLLARYSGPSGEDSPVVRNLVVRAQDVRDYLAQRREVFGAQESTPFLGDARLPTTTVVPRIRPEDISKADVVRALEACGGNKTRAAKSLGIVVNTLKKRLRESD